jgi:hypothetical protein
MANEFQYKMTQAQLALAKGDKALDTLYDFILQKMLDSYNKANAFLSRILLYFTAIAREFQI